MIKSINIANHLLHAQKYQSTENKDYDNQYVKGVISNQEIKKKMTRLRYELNALSDKIGKSRDDDVSFAYQKEYEIRQKEFNFFKDLKRRIQSLSVDNHPKLSVNQTPKHIQRSSSQKRNTSLHENSPNRLPNLSPELIIKLKQRLQQQFLDYCKKKSSLPAYFSEVAPESTVMKYKGFLLFMKHAGIEQVLTFEERLRIFNKSSKFKKRLIYSQFQYALEECCRYICDKHQRKFSKHNFHIFLSNILAKLEISFIVPQNHSIKKLQIHTGLFKQSMQDMIDYSRRHFQVKRAKSIISRKKLLANVKQPFSLNRSISLNKKQNSTNTLQPRPIDSISPFKKIELEPISYTSLMKNHKIYQNKNRLAKEKMAKGNNQQSHRSRNANQRPQYTNEINSLVNLNQPDYLLQQMLSKSYQK